MDEKCLTCRFWNSPFNRADEFHGGACRRHAPVLMTLTTNRSFGPEAEFPQTQGRDWCGDYVKGPVMPPEDANG